MLEAKNTQRALVRIGYDGRVHKYFRGPNAAERFANEVRVLRILEERGCAHVPRVLEAHEDQLYLVTTNCGSRVERISENRVKELFAELERDYGVRHDDPFDRNVTYRASDGRFCLIDFEFATVLDPPAKPAS
jgi:tRNA A-37 threonylcarbamoyl transferase component Bud32